MHAITLAKKDLLLLARQKSSMFFALVWPFLIAIFFGVIFSGGGGASGKPPVVVVDLDNSESSQAFFADLSAVAEIEVDQQATHDAARELVRTRQRTAAIIIPKGYGEASKNMFYGKSPSVTVMIDPSRKAEEAMIKGLLQGLAGQGMSKKMMDPQASQTWLPNAMEQAQGDDSEAGKSLQNMLSSISGFMQSSQNTPLDPSASSDAQADAWQPLVVNQESVQRQRVGPQNSFAITFPQGMLWGIIGCIMTFATSLVLERVNGTFLRLRASPMRDWQVMAGKALACTTAIILVTSALAIVARFAFDVRPDSWGLLILATASAALCFTGVMMFISSLSDKVAGVSGAGWALMMPMMMLGGGMIPLFMMPAWMNSVSNFSPVKWAILALEGAIWRGFSFQEILLPCVIMLTIGVVFFAVGTKLYARRGL